MPDKIHKTDEEWRQQLTPEQYYVTRQQGTEPAFSGAYAHQKGTGRYLCVCCDKELFQSQDKFDSGTGWPSFTQPVDPAAISRLTDQSLGMSRVEIRCTRCDAHLGHVFDDGPLPTGERYCINSLSLKFSGNEPKDR